MPSNRIAKVNIDRDQLEFISMLAHLKGISITKMLEQIILAYTMNYDPRANKEISETIPPVQ